MKPKRRSIKNLQQYQSANPEGSGWVPITTLTPKQLMDVLADYMDFVDTIEYRARGVTQVIEVFQRGGGSR